MIGSRGGHEMGRGHQKPEGRQAAGRSPSALPQLSLLSLSVLLTPSVSSQAPAGHSGGSNCISAGPELNTAVVLPTVAPLTGG